jgi:hypothetical protein
MRNQASTLRNMSRARQWLTGVLLFGLGLWINLQILRIVYHLFDNVKKGYGSENHEVIQHKPNVIPKAVRRYLGMKFIENQTRDNKPGDKKNNRNNAIPAEYSLSCLACCHSFYHFPVHIHIHHEIKNRVVLTHFINEVIKPLHWLSNLLVGATNIAMKEAREIGPLFFIQSKTLPI